MKTEIECLICFKSFLSLKCLSAHLYRMHNGKKEYYDKYLKKENEGMCLTCSKQTNFLSLISGYQKYCNTICANNHPDKIKNIQNTNIKNHGVISTNQCPQIKEKKRQTSLKHYGLENPNQSLQIKEKKRQTNLKRRGVEISFQSEDVKEKSKQTCKKNYGVDNYSKTFEFRKFAREQMISFVESGLKNGQTFSPTKGQNEKPFISDLQKYTNYFIDNDAKIIGYFPDGYIKELYLIIEFDEPWHNRTCYKKRDIQKDEDYQKIGLRIFRVSEKQWKENKEQVIEQFIQILNILQESYK